MAKRDKNGRAREGTEGTQRTKGKDGARGTQGIEATEGIRFAIVIVAATLIAYLPAIFAGYVWDDDRYLTNNISIRMPSGLFRIWLRPFTNTSPYPLVFTTFWMEYRLWGLNPMGYHVVNILLHAANSLLVGMILRRAGFPGARLAAAAFALHPIHVESVAWVTERKDVLSGLFYLLSLHVWLRWIGSRSRRDYGAALALFAAAMFSKTVACSMPVAALLLAWKKDPGNLKRNAAASIPFFALGLVLAAATIWWERHRTGATDEAIDLKFLERLLIAGRAPWFYAGKLLWPGSLMTIYPRWELDAASAAQWLFTISSVALAAGLILARKRIGDGPALATIFYVAALGPALGFFNFSTMVYTFVSDHYQYLAGAGLIALGAGLVARLGERMAIPKRWRAGAAVGLFAALGAATWSEAGRYKDQESLFRATIRKNPSAWNAYFSVGIALDEKGKAEEAIGFYEKALALKPDYAKAMINLGLAREAQGKPEEALQVYLAAMKIDPRNAGLLSNLGAFMQKQGKPAEAERYLTQALAADPAHVESLVNLGFIRLRAKQYDAAMALYARALEANPYNADALNHMGTAFLEQGKLGEAAEYFGKAIAIKPNHDQALANLAIALLRQGRQAEAIAA